ncbi:ABC transporter [Bacillus sp. BD59S]|nr:ABC transporter [Bacillus sp. BD59S]
MDNQYLNVIGFGGLFINAILLVKVATHEKRKFMLK